MIGCYGCDYTRKTYPIIQELVNQTGASFTFMEFPVKVKTDLMSRVGYCVYQKDPQAFWKFADTLFVANKVKLDDEAFAAETVSSLGLDSGQVMACASDAQTRDTVTAQMQEVLKTNFYGTPTVFINNGTPLVGPKPYRVYAIMLEGLLYWLK
jgi:protein-disulfide isomerase